MTHYSRQQQFLSVITLFVMFFNPILQSAALAAAPVRPVTSASTSGEAETLPAPSELAESLPRPEAPESRVNTPLLDDPTTLALEQALGGVVDSELIGGGIARIDPLASNPAPGIKLPQLSAPIPELVNPLDSIQVDLPQAKADPLAGLPSFDEDIEDDSLLAPLADLPVTTETGDAQTAATATQDQRLPSEGSITSHTPSSSLSEDTAPSHQIETDQQPETSANLISFASGITHTTYLPIAMGGGAQASPEIIEVEINPGTGGIIETEGGNLQATFSRTAVGQDTRIRYEELGPQLSASSMSAVGPAFSISAWDATTGVSVTQFPPQVSVISATGTVTGNDYIPAHVESITPSIIISIHYTAADVQGLDLRTLALYSRQNANHAWQREPSAVYQEQNLLVAHIDHLTEFALMAEPLVDPLAVAELTAMTATTAITMRIALDPDDNVGHADWPGVGYITELPKNVALAEGVKSKLENDCQAIVTLTRDGGSDYVARSLRRDNALNFGAEMFVTIAFDALKGFPWGYQSDGGTWVYIRTGNADDQALADAVNDKVVQFTGRRHYPTGTFFYGDYSGLAMPYAHIEALYLDHNYDWPVINQEFDNIVDGVYTALRGRLETMGMTCFVDPNDPGAGTSPYPAPPSAEELQRLRDLGYQNYQKYGADPVSFSTGNYVYQNTLAQIPWRADTAIDFTLTYNGQDGRDDAFGYGWSFPYNARAQHYSDDSITLALHDGRTRYFVPDGDGYEAQAGVFDTLERVGETTLEFTQPDGVVMTFEEMANGFGILTEWQDRSGNTLIFDYDLSGQPLSSTTTISPTAIPRPPLTGITDNTSRTIIFESDADSHITKATLPDGREFGFAYTNGDLTEISDPNGGTRRFEYDDQHRLTKHWDPENIMYLENIYDDEDRVIEQVDASGSHMYLSYSDGETLFTDNLGNETRYFYDDLNRVTAVEDALGYREEFTYDDEYNLTAYTDKRGHTWTYTYDENGNRLTETDPLGNVTTYVYNDANDMTSMTDALGRTTTFEYDADGNLLKTTRPDGSTVAATYDGYGQMLTMIDANGHTTRYEYNSQGNLVTVTDPLGNITRYEYDLAGRQTKMIDANGHTAQFEYDDNDNITRIIDPKGAETRFEYDLNDNLTRMTDRLGRETTFQYDENLKLIAETDPAGGTTRYDYDLMYNLVEMVDPLGNVTRYSYDALYQLTAMENALGGVRQTEYDPNGNMAKAIDELGRETTNAYDPLNRLTKVTDALGGETSYEYNAVGLPVRETNPRGAVTEYEYDSLNRLSLRRDALGGEWLSGFDGVGNLTSRTNANGHTTGYAYDAANRQVEQTDPNGYTTSFTYDGVGNRLTVTDALGRVTRRDYDENDNLVKITDALAGITTFSYDAEDNLILHTDANNRATGYEYDALTRLTRLIENYRPGEAAAADVNVTTQYTYDAVGNLLTLTDANGNVTIYEYDALYRLTKETDAENQATAYDYDAVDNLIELTNPRGYQTGYAYDDLDRLLTQTDAQGNSWQYAYDPAGNLTDQTDPLGVVTRHEYDLLDRLTATTQNYISGGAATVDQNVTTRFEYDAVGNLRLIHDPRGGYQTEYRYDPADRRIMTVDAEGGETEFIFDAVYNLVKVIDANDHETTTAYDALNRPVTITNPEGHSIKFTYDAAGNLVILLDARGNSTTFAYDGMYRLVLRLDAMLGQWRYSYDPVGNLLGEVDANGHANNSYSYDKVYRLLTRTDAQGYVTAYSYDENGNRLTLTDGNGHVTTYSYDELDRLVAGTNAENETTRYGYDPLGNQTALTEADGVTTRYDYDPLYRLVTVTQNYIEGAGENADTNVDTRYSYDEVGNLLAILDAEDHETRFSYDGLNRLVQEVDALGNTWDYEYDPVGNRTARIDALRHRTEYSYYPDDQLHSISYYDGATVSYSYDQNNNRLTMVDSLGSTTLAYDALNRVTGVTDPFGRHLGYTYDPVGNRTGLTYPDGHTVSYAYYDNNWLQTMVDPEGNATVYDRDGVGQMTRTLNPNNTVAEASYDQANRLLTLRSYQVGGKTNSAFSYTYNQVGHRTQMVAEYGWRNPGVVTSDYSYDALRRLTRDADSEGRWTDYTFDRVGNRLTLTTNDDSLSPRPFDDNTLLYSYNAINQLLTVVGDTRPGQGSINRKNNVGQALYAFRHEVTAQRGKHITTAAADDLLALADTLLSDLESNPAPGESNVTIAIETIRAQVAAYRTAGDIDRDGIENSLLAKLNKGDQANSGSSGDLQTTLFTYDANGNRINKEFPGPQGPQIQGTDYAYDPENRLVEAQDYQGNQPDNRIDRAVTTLAYDGNGRRLLKEYDPKTGNGGAKRVEYVFDGLDPVAEYNTQNGQYDNYYRAEAGRIASMQHFSGGSAGQMFWFHHDGLGSTAGLTKQNGQSSHNYRYEPYGQIETPSGNFTDPHNHYTFTGQALDENMAVYEFFARAYDYETGVWLQQDPYRGDLNQPTTLHRYGYVLNNPVNLIDPLGFSARDGSWDGSLHSHIDTPTIEPIDPSVSYPTLPCSSPTASTSPACSTTISGSWNVSFRVSLSTPNFQALGLAGFIELSAGIENGHTIKGAVSAGIEWDPIKNNKALFAVGEVFHKVGFHIVAQAEGGIAGKIEFNVCNGKGSVQICGYVKGSLGIEARQQGVHDMFSGKFTRQRIGVQGSALAEVCLNLCNGNLTWSWELSWSAYANFGFEWFNRTYEAGGQISSGGPKYITTISRMAILGNLGLCS